MADRSARLITKRTSVPSKIPTGTTSFETNFIRSGELASNLADKKLFGFDGTTVFEYGTNSFLNITGGTVSGNLEVTGNFSASTIFSGDTDLYNIFSTTDFYVTGGTASSGGTLALNRNDAMSVIITGLASSDQIISQDSILDIYQTGTTATSGTAYKDIIWDSEAIVGADYSYSGAEITILSDGYYEVVYTLSIDILSGSRKTSRNRLILDSGGGYNEITRTATYGYHRNSSSGKMSLTKNIKQQFTAGDKIKAQISRNSGNGNLTTIAGDSNITITKLAI